jgi:hypothetical protein
VLCKKGTLLERQSVDIFSPKFSGMLAAQILNENAKMVMFTSLVVLLGIICVVANIDTYSENRSMIPVVINTWPFTSATQSGKNSHVTIEIRGGFRCDNCIRRVSFKKYAVV